jgi:hypothetical protein
VRTALGPVDARARERPAAATERGQVDAEGGERRRIAQGEARAIERAGRADRVGQRDADDARHVVVARPRGALGSVAVAGAQRADRRRGSDRGEALDRLRHVLVGEPAVAVAALALDHHQARARQPGEMRACRRARDARGAREVGRGQRAAAEHGGEHAAAGRMADRGGDARDVCFAVHARHCREATVRRLTKRRARSVIAR